MFVFSVFGEIKALRLPKKMTVGSDSHRGFAFVDYVTATDAKVKKSIYFYTYESHIVVF